MNRRVAINLAFFVGVFVVMLWWAANNIITIDALERPYTISATFEHASGIQRDAEVTYLGIAYGRVDTVERVPGGVRVRMKIDRDKEIPQGSIARIFRKSAIGEPYIDFVPPQPFDAATAAMIPAGGEVPIEDTTVPIEFAELLRSASAVISSVDPEAAASLLDELALALRGRSPDLRRLTTSVDELTATFAARTEQLDRLADNSTRVTRAVASERANLGRAIENLALVADTLERAKDDVRILLDEGTRFIGTTAELVSDQKQNLDCLFSDLEGVIRLAGSDAQLANLSRQLRDGPTAFGYMYNSLDEEADGTWIRVHLLVALEDPADVYVPPRQMPSVPAVPACDSDLVAAAGSFTDGGARPVTGIGAGTLPATGGSATPVLALALAAAATATWRLRLAPGRPR